jgi:leucine dehydrogenase
MIVETLVIDGYERVVHFTEEDFSAYIALHSTYLGPALGGCRITHYDRDEDALTDVLRLSKGMTLKNAVAHLDYGGGKCVVNRAAPPDSETLKRIADAVDFFRGDYITAEDVGTTLDHMLEMAKHTQNVVASDNCDPSPWTARGVFSCIKTAAAQKGIRPGWTRAAVYVQGLGKVGSEVARSLHAAGFTVYADDIDKSRIPPYAIPYTADYDGVIDIYVPCAMGAVVNAANVDKLPYKVICGSANNQLETDDLAKKLRLNGCLYCPDFLVNAGGVIAVAAKLSGHVLHVPDTVDNLGQILHHAIQMAKKLDITPLEMAMMTAQERL